MTTAYEHKTQLVGDDYLGLPTRPVTYRGRRHESTVDWDQIQADYVAHGGKVDDSVWPNHGKVVVIGGSANSSRANIHTFTEAQDDRYEEPAAPTRARRGRASNTSTATTGAQRVIKVPAEMRPEIGRRYAAGESIIALARAYGVSEGSIRFAVKKAGVPIRSKAEAAALLKQQGQQS